MGSAIGKNKLWVECGDKEELECDWRECFGSLLEQANEWRFLL
jgi:hypothetical protein